MINRIQSNAAPSAWPDRLTSLVKAVWASVVHRPPQPATAYTVAENKPVLLHLRASLLPGRSDVVCLAVEGELNRHTYESLIEIASIHYHQGRRSLVLDLCQTTQLELSGLFALLSIAHLYSGQSLIDPEEGWAGLRRAAESVDSTLGERVKLVAPSPTAVAALEQASFCRFFTRYPDMDPAMTTFAIASSTAS